MPSRHALAGMSKIRNATRIYLHFCLGLMEKFWEIPGLSFTDRPKADPKTITIRLDRLNPSVKKIVFVLTIHEAFEKNFNFGMITDAYIRILHPDSHSEAVSFQMKECSSNVISMMIGEIYLHNDEWKFGAIGNGIAGDLAGLCAFYGVEVTD